MAIPAQRLVNKGIQPFGGTTFEAVGIVDTVAALKAFPVAGLTTGYSVHVNNFAAALDGGGGIFRYDSASATATDLGTVFAPNAGPGRWKRVYFGAVNVKWFGAVGDGATDDTTAIQAALTAFLNVYLPPSTFIISTALNLSANQKVYGDAGTIIKAKAAFATNYMVQMAQSSEMFGITVDGVNMTAPTSQWLGVGTPVGSGVYIPGTVGTHVTLCMITRCTFKNFPSGALFAPYADDLVISFCKAINCQTYVGFETNACFETYTALRVQFSNLEISTFNWKGINCGNSSGSIMQSCVCNGGTAGMASHYYSGSDACVISGCYQTGGFGIKCFNCSNITITGFISNGSSNTGIYMQAVLGFTITNCIVENPTGKGIIVEGINGTGPSTHGVIQGCNFNWPIAATTANQVGVYLSAGTAAALDDILIVGCTFNQAYYGIQCPDQSASAGRIRVKDCTFTASLQYSIVGYFQSVEVNGCDFKANNLFPFGFFGQQTGIAGDYIRVIDNTSNQANAAGDHWEITNALGHVQFEVVEFRGNYGENGATFCTFLFNNAVGDYVHNFIFDGNLCYNQNGASPVNVTFNTTTHCFGVMVCNNIAQDNTGALKNVTLTNTALLNNVVLLNNSINSPVQFVSATLAVGAAVALANGVPSNALTLALPIGTWDLEATVGFHPAATTTASVLQAAVSTVTGTLPLPSAGGIAVQTSAVPAGLPDPAISTGRTRVVQAAAGNVFAVAQATFAVSTMGAYGFIRATKAA